MMMTKNKSGACIFVKGGEYKIKTWVNPVWPPNQTSKCLDVENDGKRGLFQNGDDVRWWVANDQFEEV
jgi:hypothetical protein